MFVGVDGGGMVALLPERPRALLSPVVGAADAPGDQRHPAGGDTASTVTDEQARVVGGQVIVESQQPETLSRIVQPLDPSAPVRGDRQGELLAVTPLGEVPHTWPANQYRLPRGMRSLSWARFRGEIAAARPYMESERTTCRVTFSTCDGHTSTCDVTKNPNGGVYDQVFENDIGRVGACVTDTTGQCTAGEEAVGDYLVIVKYVDVALAKTAYTGKPQSPPDFVDSNGEGLVDLATKDFQVIKPLRKDGVMQFSGGSKTVVTGSYLEIIQPDFAVWENVVDGYVYPFIFSSDSDWPVDVCTQVLEGYEIVGVYDENGDFISNAACVQTIIAAQTKVVAFRLIDIRSPEPALKARLKLKHHGKLHALDVAVPGVRRGKKH